MTTIIAPQIERHAMLPGWDLAVAIERNDDDRQVLAIEPVSAADLADLRAGAVFETQWQSGRIVGFDQTPVGAQPVFNEAGNCAGLELEVTGPTGAAHRIRVPVAAFELCAHRRTGKLIEPGVLDSGERYLFGLRATPRHEQAGDQGAAPTGAPNVRRSPHCYLESPQPLGAILARARTVGRIDDTFAVAYTEQALAKAERFALAGCKSDKPVESGGLLIGVHVVCPPPDPALLVVVTDCLELWDAEATVYEIVLERCWPRLLNVIDARQLDPALGGAALRLLGTAHCHPFLPAGGAPPCAICHQQAECSRRTDRPSIDDRVFLRCTFPNQPWALTHLWGMNARAEQTTSLHTLCRGVFVERGFHVIDEFDPASCTIRTA